MSLSYISYIYIIKWGGFLVAELWGGFLVAELWGGIVGRISVLHAMYFYFIYFKNALYMQSNKIHNWNPIDHPPTIGYYIRAYFI